MAALRYPDFICIGAQKAGTTWLYRMLRGQSGLWLPPLKEIHYFDRAHRKPGRNAPAGPTALDLARTERVAQAMRSVDSSSAPTREKREQIASLALIGKAALTDEWYGAIFQAAPGSSLCGEITPEYALLPDAGVNHMLRLQPKSKIIFVLRDPIERGWSHLRMERSKGRSPLAARWVAQPGFFAYADYMSTIERYRRHVAAEDFLTMYFDDIAERPRAQLEQVCAFLGLDGRRVDFRDVSVPVHAGPPSPMEPEYYDAARERLLPVYRQLLALDHPVTTRWFQRHYGE